MPFGGGRIQGGFRVLEERFIGLRVLKDGFRVSGFQGLGVQGLIKGWV